MKFSIESDAGSAGARFSATPTDLAAAGGTLSDLGSRSGEARRYGEVGGVGEYTSVASAAAAMVAAWNPALDGWQRSLDSLGRATVVCGQAITETDESLASAWGAGPFVASGGAR